MIPKVSVITPCYNAESTITDTIESVLSQTYSDWEMIVIDDSSTDKSVEIIKTYVSKDLRIKYLHTDKPSGSPALPRNIGLDSAIGKYIAFLDADDVWLPTKLEEQVFELEANKYEFVYSDYEKMNSLGLRENRCISLRNTSTYWDVLESCSIPCLTAIVRKDVIGSVRFKSIAKEDYAFWLDILRKGVIAHNTGKIHALYRVLQNSRSSNKFDMIRNQWNVLRNVEGVKPVVACYFMLRYLYSGFAKYLK